MKKIVRFFINKDGAFAEYINHKNGKPSYYNAQQVIKSVIPGKTKYKVKVKDGRVVKVLSQVHFKIRKKDLRRALKKMNKALI